MQYLKRIDLLVALAALLVSCSVERYQPIETSDPASEAWGTTQFDATSRPVHHSDVNAVFQGHEVEELMKIVGECASPCVWGIVPGQTSHTSAVDFLNPLRDVYGDFPFWATVVLGSSAQQEMEVSLRIDLHSRDEVVDLVNARLIPAPGVVVTSEDWAAFNLEKILSQYGPPSDIRIAIVQGQGNWIQYGLLIIYEQYDFQIEYIDPGSERDLSGFLICPARSDEYISFELQLGGTLREPSEYYLPLNSVSDFSIQDFYSLISNQPKSCLQVNGKNS